MKGNRLPQESNASLSALSRWRLCSEILPVVGVRSAVPVLNWHQSPCTELIHGTECGFKCSGQAQIHALNTGIDKIIIHYIKLRTS
jgi:hypothetical protein